MKKELIFLSIIIVTAVLFFTLRSNMDRNKKTTNGGTDVTVYPTIEEQEEFATEIPLTVSEPDNNSVVTSPNIVVSGKTTPNADVLVNDIELKADAQGNFRTSLILDIGNNIITIVANNDQGDYAETEIVVELKESAEEPPQQ